MIITIGASTKEGYELSRKEALLMGGRAAGICYEPGMEFRDEPLTQTEARIKRTLDSAHQSVYEHGHYKLDIVGMPKALVMILNNQNAYVTSEKSARFTQMQSSGREKELYDKWMGILNGLIQTKYPKIPEDKRQKLAQENARYMTSVFTLTKMSHTLSFRQLNFFMHWFEDFSKRTDLTDYERRLIPYMQAFNQTLERFYVLELNPADRLRHLTLFAERERKEEFGENYCVNYEGTPAQLAQAQRHRTLRYEMGRIHGVPNTFFAPPIIEDQYLLEEWGRDIISVADAYPQGMLIRINERGAVEDFVSKLGERLCGNAQLEIALQSKETLNKYLEATKEDPVVHSYLTQYARGARCTFPDYTCKSRCGWGAKKALERMI